ncbi:MAG: DUF2318 domain-containing protein [Acidobacteriota bacterium]
MNYHKDCHSTQVSRHSKQARFQEPEKRGTYRSLLAAATVLIALLVIVAVYLTSRASDGQAVSIQAPAAGDVRIPLAELDGGQARFFRYRLPNDREVEFFALKAADGAYRAAFNACDVCYEGRQGYRQDGNAMVCRKCSQQFPSQQINLVRGGCNPVPLDREVVGNSLSIRLHDLQRGTAYFE